MCMIFLVFEFEIFSAGAVRCFCRVPPVSVVLLAQPDLQVFLDVPAHKDHQALLEKRADR